jgi:NTE family protein
MGATRVLVLGLRYEDSDEDWPPRAPEASPPPLVLLGKLLNSLMLDRVDYDIARLEGFNQILRNGTRAFGADFVSHLTETAQRVRGQSYRQVDTVLIRPSGDIGQIATDFVRTYHPHMGGTPGWILSKFASSDALARSDLMSYLLFDGRFAERLIELGKRDADAARSKLIDFFKD